MTAPHEVPPTGVLGEWSAGLRAALPVLETTRTRLRAPRLEDFPSWAEILCSDRAAWMDGPYDRDGAFVEFEASIGSWLLRGYGPWTVEARDSGEVLGFVLLNMEPSDHETELGYFLRAPAEGRGLASEAVAATRDWAWGQGIASLVSYVDPPNLRSSGLARRLGAARDPAAEAAYAGTDSAGIEVWRHPRPEPPPERPPMTPPEAPR